MLSKLTVKPTNFMTLEISVHTRMYTKVTSILTQCFPNALPLYFIHSGKALLTHTSDP